MSYFTMGQLGQEYVDPTASLRTAFTEGEIDLPEYYRAPPEKLLRSAYLERKMKLQDPTPFKVPAHYKTPRARLGKKGKKVLVKNPAFAAAQAAAVQWASQRIPVWGQPQGYGYGYGPTTKVMTPVGPPSPGLTNPPAFNYQTGSFPIPGTAVERF